MSRDRNQIFIEGNLISDPILGKTRDGRATCNYRVASSDNAPEGSPNVFNVCTFGKQAEDDAKNLQRNSRVDLAGSMQVRNKPDMRFPVNEEGHRPSIPTWFLLPAVNDGVRYIVPQLRIEVAEVPMVESATTNLGEVLEAAAPRARRRKAQTAQAE
jgi:hypothetical protein